MDIKTTVRLEDSPNHVGVYIDITIEGIPMQTIQVASISGEKDVGKSLRAFLLRELAGGRISLAELREENKQARLAMQKALEANVLPPEGLY